jgi:hypothetical protein
MVHKRERGTFYKNIVQTMNNNYSINIISVLIIHHQPSYLII